MSNYICLGSVWFCWPPSAPPQWPLYHISQPLSEHLCGPKGFRYLPRLSDTPSFFLSLSFLSFQTPDSMKYNVCNFAQKIFFLFHSIFHTLCSTWVAALDPVIIFGHDIRGQGSHQHSWWHHQGRTKCYTPKHVMPGRLWIYILITFKRNAKCRIGCLWGTDQLVFESWCPPEYDKWTRYVMHFKHLIAEMNRPIWQLWLLWRFRKSPPLKICSCEVWITAQQECFTLTYSFESCTTELREIWPLQPSL